MPGNQFRTSVSGQQRCREKVQSCGNYCCTQGLFVLKVIFYYTNASKFSQLLNHLHTTQHFPLSLKKMYQSFIFFFSRKFSTSPLSLQIIKNPPSRGAALMRFVFPLLCPCVHEYILKSLFTLILRFSLKTSSRRRHYSTICINAVYSVG